MWYCSFTNVAVLTNKIVHISAYLHHNEFIWNLYLFMFKNAAKKMKYKQLHLKAEYWLVHRVLVLIFTAFESLLF